MAYTKQELDEVMQINSDAAYWYQYRRHPDWTENYTLYRDRVMVNRITQRQTVNIPMMKYIVMATLKAIDDPCDLYFHNRDNDEQKEIFANSHWNQVVRDEKINMRDIIDKKQQLIYGRSTTGWNVLNGRVKFEMDDAFDVFFDQFTDPTDIDGTCRYMDQRHIFVPLSQLALNKNYDQKVVHELQEYYAKGAGVVKAAENTRSLIEKNMRATLMGQVNVNTPRVGETYVELHKRWMRLPGIDGEDEIWYNVAAAGKTLLHKRQEEIIGETKDHYWRNHFIKTSWAADVERNDMYSDGVADMVRPANRVINAWYSQLIENRTMSSFGMNFFNSNIEGFVPQTFEPMPWGMYPIPLNPNQKITDVIQNVPVPTLADSIGEMQFLMGITEKAASTPVTQLGQLSQQRVTLGEIEVVLQQASDRLKMMKHYYIPAWAERGEKFQKLVEAQANNLDAVKIFEHGVNNKDRIYKKELGYEDWQSEEGYETEVTNKTDQNAQTAQVIQALQAVQQAMPGNQALLKIYDRSLLNIVPDLTAQEIQDVMDEQKKIRANAMMNPMGGAGAPNMTPNTMPVTNPIQPIQPAPGVIKPDRPPKPPVPGKEMVQPAVSAAFPA